MDKYDPLFEYFQGIDNEDITKSFSEIEAILGDSLPFSAYGDRSWWGNTINIHRKQAKAWMEAGYRVHKIDMLEQRVTFERTHATIEPQTGIEGGHLSPVSPNNAPTPVVETERIFIGGYEFLYVQELIPKCDSNGRVITHSPQENYLNVKKLPISRHGSGEFCSFSIDAENSTGVYLWVTDGTIIYIGETLRLRHRFNNGYGHISPKNCFRGGRPTNCKMNKVVLDCYQRGKPVRLFFYQTDEYKRVERDLISIYRPLYNGRR